MYYIFRCHTETRYGGIIAKPPSRQNWLDLAQIVVQWACSFVMLVFPLLEIFQSYNHLHVNRLVLVIEFSSSSSGPANNIASSARRTSMAGPAAFFFLLLHAGISIMFAAIAGEPLRQWNNPAFLVIMAAQACIANPFASAFLIVAFVYQLSWANARRTAGKDSASALSKYALAAQSATSLALAILWPFRLELPRTLRGAGLESLFEEWYPFVGWASVNAFVMAVGQYILLYSVSAADFSDMGSTNERIALLGPSI